MIVGEPVHVQNGMQHGVEFAIANEEAISINVYVKAAKDSKDKPVPYNEIVAEVNKLIGLIDSFGKKTILSYKNGTAKAQGGN